MNCRAIRRLMFVLVALALSFGDIRPLAARQCAELPSAIACEIPEAERAAFEQRLCLLIRFQVAGQWHDVFTMLGPLYLQGRSEADYVATRERYAQTELGAMTEFLPTSIVNLDRELGSGEWTVVGCGVVSVANERKVYLASLEAYLIDGVWYFSDINWESPGPVDCTPGRDNLRPAGVDSARRGPTSDCNGARAPELDRLSFD